MTVPIHPMAELVSFLDASSDPCVVFDLHHRILATNTAYREQVAPGRSVLGRRCYEIFHHYTVPCDQAGESCPLVHCKASGQRERVLQLHHTPDGESYMEIEVTPIRDTGGEVVYYVEKMLSLQARSPVDGEHRMIGRAPAFQHMLGLVARVAKSDAVVLLEGESGTGKELVAHAVHRGSRRARAPFIAVDCTGIPEALFESELFGHERGAFTGANARKLGLIEAASGGSLLLDEVGEIPLSMQVKLLRLLETGTYRRVGSSEVRQADVRVISATHRPLRAMVEEGSFRADLYYRLNVFPIKVPALRDRAEDIPLLIPALLHRVAPGRELRVSESVLRWLMDYPFHGNVRELRNLLERASLMCDGPVIEPEHLPDELLAGLSLPQNMAGVPSDEELINQLALHRGPRSALARKLGLSERTLYRRLQALRDKKPESA
jgi:two-component system response regulator HydG